MPIYDLPPEFDIFSRLAEAQEKNVRELFQYSLTQVLLEDHKAEVLEQRTSGMRAGCSVKTAAGHFYSLFVPEIRDELLEQVRGMVREAMEESK